MRIGASRLPGPRGWLVTLVLLAGLAAAGCAAVAKAGKPPANPELLRHSNFWNFYRRAIARMEDKRWAEAAQDLERCLGLREGAKFSYPFDLWRVRTYGLHVTEHYFPHRELGVCRLELGQPGPALELLEKSLKQEPSARARHYINLARERLVRDAPHPAPTVAAGDAGIVYSRNPRVEIRGRAHGDAYVGQVLVNGRSQFIELAEKEVKFRQALDLAPGTHEVAVEAVDLKGQRTRQAIRVVVDPVSPQFQFATARRVGAAWHLQGVCADAFGLRQVTRDGQPLALAAGPEARQTALDLILEDGREIRLTATDWAGNTLESSVREHILPRLLARRGAALSHANWAAAGDAPAPGPGPAGLPTLALDGLHDLNVTYEDHFFVSGMADDSRGITAIRVQGAQVLELAKITNNLTRFGCFVPVKPGANELELVAEAEGGRSVKTRVTVERREPAFAAPALRLAATLPPLFNAEALRTAGSLQEMLLAALVNRPAPFEPRFQVLARGEDLLAVLQELRLNLSDLVDDRARVPYGKLATTDLFLNGEVLADPGGHTVRLHTIDAGSSEWLGADDIYLPRAGTDMDLQLRGLAAKVERRFPVVSGVVPEIGGRSIRLPVGSESGLTTGARLLVIRPGQDGSYKSGSLVRTGANPLELLVTKATPGQAIVRLSPGAPTDAARAGDWFYSR